MPIIVPPTGSEVSGLVDRIVAAGGVLSVSSADALARLNSAHDRMVARSKCFRKTLALGPLEAGVSFYAVPTEVIEPVFFTVDGAPYGKARRADVYAYGQGRLTWRGAYGLVVYGADSEGVEGVTLIPPPATAGGDLELLAVCHSPVLTLADTPLVDRDFWDDLVDFAIALGREREDERFDTGGTLRAYFDQRCEEMRVRAKRRQRGPGPAQIRVVGVNA